MKRQKTCARVRGNTEKWKTIILLSIILLICVQVFAGPETGIDNATAEVKKYYKNAINLMYAIGAVTGIVGAIKVYNKWNSGDQDVNKSAAAWFGSCIFLVVVATILSGFFGV